MSPLRMRQERLAFSLLPSDLQGDQMLASRGNERRRYAGETYQQATGGGNDRLGRCATHATSTARRRKQLRSVQQESTATDHAEPARRVRESTG